MTQIAEEQMHRKTKFVALAVATAAVGVLSAQAIAASNTVKITEVNGQRCVISNNIPDHQTGKFPNSGNPNSISSQSIKLCVDATPIKGSSPKDMRGTIGFALNGVIIRPGTADWYDASASRGHSRDRSSGWNLDGVGARELLGLDSNNAHVGPDGEYHYHAPSDGILAAAQGTLIGYAADGHEIHYVGSGAKPSWQLKSGTRETAPGGQYDGTYNQDFEFVAGSGNLDLCNGGTMNGEYVYFATDTYPFFPRCAYGEISSDFTPGGGQRADQSGQDQRRGQGLGQRLGKLFGKKDNRPEQANLDATDRPNLQQRRGGKLDGGELGDAQGGNRRGPPQFAFAACESKAVGNSCSMTTPRGQISGQCVLTPDQQTACRPQRR